MDGVNECELQKQNNLKKKLYSIFHNQIEKDIIDMVLSNCEYKENLAYEHLIGMAPDPIDLQVDNNNKTVLVSTNNTKITPPDPKPLTPSTSFLERAYRPPTNLLEQLSAPSQTNSYPSSCITPGHGQIKPLLSAFPQHLTSSYTYSMFARNQDSKTLPMSVPKLNEIENLKALINAPGSSYLVIMRGLPGSGKSYKAKLLCGDKGLVCSTDDYFCQGGIYQFDKSLLTNAHEWNQKRANKGMLHGYSPVFIDNTNLQAWEMRPYVAMGINHNYTMMILEPDSSWAWIPSLLAKKNLHNVPKESIENMQQRYEKNVSIEYMKDLVKGNCQLHKASLPKLKGSSSSNNKGKVTFVKPRSVRNTLAACSNNTEGDSYFDRLDNPVPTNINVSKSLPTASCTNPKIDKLSSLEHFSRDHLLSYDTIQRSSSVDFVVDLSFKETGLPTQITGIKANTCITSYDLESNHNKAFEIKESSVPINTKVISNTKIPADVLSSNDVIHNLDNTKYVFAKPPQVTSSVVNEVETLTLGEPSSSNNGGAKKRETTGQNSDGKIDDIVNKYKCWSSEQPKATTRSTSLQQKTFQIDLSKVDDVEMIDLTENDDTLTSFSVEISNEQIEFSLQFLYECFPDLSRSYCKKWLKRYNSDLVKTCDYLSRASQLDDLEIDGDEDEEDADNDNILSEDDFETGLELPADHPEDRNVQAALSKILNQEAVQPSGELFYCDGEQDKNTMKIAIDKRFARELMDRFAKTGDVEEHTLSTDDFILTVDNDIGERLYSSWMSTVKAKKRKLETLLFEDEQFALKLQEEENKRTVNQLNSPDGKGKSKKKKLKPLPINTEYSKGSPATLFEPESPWKKSQDAATTKVTDASGLQLTAKQQKVQQELFKKFPGVDEKDLDQVLSATSYNLEAAVILVEDSCRLIKNKPVEEVRDVDIGGSVDWKVVESPPRKKIQSSDSSTNVNAIGLSKQITYKANNNGSVYQTMDLENQDYADFRAEARLHLNLRAEYFQKAAKAFQSKQGHVAQYYADKARDHEKKMQEAHDRAATLTLLLRNKEYIKEQRIIDLHGLHTKEALIALGNFLDNAYNVGHKRVKVITGRGKHSKNGFSTVRKAVQEALNRRRLAFKITDYGGSFIVNL